MSVKWKIALGLVSGVLVVTPAAVALAQPQAAACALIEYRGLDEVAPGILASSDVTNGQRLDFIRLRTAAKLLVANTFGATRASSVIVLGSTEVRLWVQKVGRENVYDSSSVFVKATGL